MNGNSIFNFFVENPYCFPLWPHEFIGPPTEHEGSLFSTPTPTLIIRFLFHSSHLTDIRWYLFMVFICIPLMISCAYFHMPISYVCISLGKMSVQVLSPFFNEVGFLTLNCMSSLYILDINSLSDTLFANIFSHSVGSLFILPVVSFTMQKIFSLI